MAPRRVTSGKVRTEQRSPVAGGDIFGQHARVAVPDYQPLLCRGQDGGRQASRSRPAPLLLTERGREEGRRGGKVARSWTPCCCSRSKIKPASFFVDARTHRDTHRDTHTYIIAGQLAGQDGTRMCCWVYTLISEASDSSGVSPVRGGLWWEM